MPRTNKKNLAMKDHRFLKLLVDEYNCNQTKMAEGTGVTQKAVSLRLAKIRERMSFAEILDIAGCTDEKIAKELESGAFHSKKHVVVDGEVIEIGIDRFARHRYLDTLLKAKKHINSEEKNNGAKIVNIIYAHGEAGKDNAKNSNPDNQYLRRQPVDGNRKPAKSDTSPSTRVGTRTTAKLSC